MFLGENAQTPSHTYRGDSGYDLCCARETLIPPHSFADVPSDIAVAFPEGIWGRIAGRSSTLRKRGLLVSEAIIDQGYTGPLFTGVWNLTSEQVVVKVGERISQLILQEVVEVEWVMAAELPSRDRGGFGFGSTGS